MNDDIELRVSVRGEERVLRIGQDEGRWYAGFLIPGQRPLVTGEIIAPSPPGTTLLKAEFDSDKMLLRIENPPGNVTSIAMGRLTASGSLSVKDGWIVVPLQGFARDYGDGEQDRMRSQKSAQILDFPTRKKRSPEQSM